MTTKYAIHPGVIPLVVIPEGNLLSAFFPHTLAVPTWKNSTYECNFIT